MAGWHTQVTRKPVIGILSTGDELLSPSAALVPGKIRDCNRATLLSWAASQGQTKVVDLGTCPDDANALDSVLHAAATQCDILITSGGVSMGEADLLKTVRPFESKHTMHAH